MLYSLSGTVTHVFDDFVVLETSGIGFRIRGLHTLESEAQAGKALRVYCYWQPEQAEVFGFLRQEELSLFELLISVSGIGPRMALKFLNAAPPAELASMILFEKRDDLAKRSGVSAKTASKVILELKEKLKKSAFADSPVTTKSMELEGLLRMLGYPRSDIEEACAAIDSTSGKIEDHLKSALKHLSSKKFKQVRT